MAIVPATDKVNTDILSDKPGTIEIVQSNLIDDRQRLIQRQGCIQAAIQSQAVFSNTTNDVEWWTLVEKTADRMIEYINRG